MTTAYAAGLRVSEVVALKVGDIESGRMVMRIENGKGGKQRYVMLSTPLLGILRSYWRLTRPSLYTISHGANGVCEFRGAFLEIVCSAFSRARHVTNRARTSGLLIFDGRLNVSAALPAKSEAEFARPDAEVLAALIKVEADSPALSSAFSAALRVSGNDRVAVWKGPDVFELSISSRIFV